jgi:hypothetical protein
MSFDIAQSHQPLDLLYLPLHIESKVDISAMESVGNILRDPFTVRGDMFYRKVDSARDIFQVYLNRTIVPSSNAREACQLLPGPIGFELLDHFVGRVTPANLSADTDLLDEAVSNPDGSQGIGVSQSGISDLPDRAIECRSLSDVVRTNLIR